ncbi:MAG: hypothetical protein K8H74_01795 [Notoacmeibacter sp.]|nr:hypothetical protein [Notoacmeibacter sp.]
MIWKISLQFALPRQRRPAPAVQLVVRADGHLLDVVGDFDPRLAAREGLLRLVGVQQDGFAEHFSAGRQHLPFVCIVVPAFVVRAMLEFG